MRVRQNNVPMVVFFCRMGGINVFRKNRIRKRWCADHLHGLVVQKWMWGEGQKGLWCASPARLQEPRNVANHSLRRAVSKNKKGLFAANPFLIP